MIELTAHRGMITDRNGEPLAISTPVESVWVSPKDVEITPERIRQLSKILDMSESDVKSRFTHSQREFIYLKRQVPPETAARVMQVDAPGVFLQREYRRYYPAGEVAAHLSASPMSMTTARKASSWPTRTGSPASRAAAT